MANSQQPLDEKLRLVREQAAMELAELRKMDERALTPRMLVRKAMLLQFEDTPDGTPQDIETVLRTALDRDDKCIEAYIELGRYYYSVLDDAQRAKLSFLKGLELLRGLNTEIVQGLIDCDSELYPDRDHREIRANYELMLLRGEEGDSNTRSRDLA